MTLIPLSHELQSSLGPTFPHEDQNTQPDCKHELKIDVCLYVSYAFSSFLMLDTVTTTLPKYDLLLEFLFEKLMLSTVGGARAGFFSLIPWHEDNC